MTVVSKEVFYANIPSTFGCEIVHPWTTNCFKGNAYTALNGAYGCLRFFLPIYIAQTLFCEKGKRKHMFKNYLRSVSYGICYLLIFVESNCIQRNFFGGFYYYNVGLISGFLSGLTVFIETDSNRKLCALTFFNLIVESIIKNLEFRKMIARTNISDTIVFMFFSSFLMYLLRTQKQKPYRNFWFYKHKQMEEANKKDDINIYKYFLKGFLQYFGIGFSVQVMKSLLGRFHMLFKNSNIMKQIIFNVDNVKFGLVTGFYVVLYRAITHTLLNAHGEDLIVHHIIAGFLSGCTYYIKPDLQFGVTAVTTTCQLLLQRFQTNYYKLPQSSDGFLFAICNGILLHLRFMNPETCPKYIKQMVATCSNKIGDEIIEGLRRIILS